MIRAFYGISIDEQVANQLKQDLSSFLIDVEGSEVRLLDPQFWHITIKFFGGIPPESLSTISKRLKAFTATIHPFTLKIKKITKFPTMASPNVAAFIKPHHNLREMHKFLDRSGEKMGIKPERRRYKPHITLAKFRSNRYAITPIKYSQFTLTVREIVLYESKPNENGSNYIPLQRFKLVE